MPARRLLIVQLGSLRRRPIAIILVTVAAAWLAVAIVRPAVARHLADAAVTIGELERAEAWAPDDPELRLRLGEVQRTAVGGDRREARVHLEAALAERGTHAGTWLRLAWLDYGEGRTDRARAALATAVRYDRHSPSVRWEASLLALAAGDRDEALTHLRYVLKVDRSRRAAAFEVARRLLQPDESMASLLPEQPGHLLGILDFAIEGRHVPLAMASWERLEAQGPSVPEPLQRRYLDLLVEAGKGAEAHRLWTTIVPGGHPDDAHEAIWNGGFEQAQLLGWGFGWRVKPTWRVDVRLDDSVRAKGRQALRVAFNGVSMTDFDGVSQLARVEPGKRYRLRALLKARASPTGPGLKLQVAVPDGQTVLGETTAVSGDTDGWVPVQADVKLPPDVGLVRVRLRRERASGPEPNFEGKVWVDEVSLRPMPGAGR